MHYDVDALIAYLQNAPGSDRERIAEHLLVCAACRRVFDDLRQVEDALRNPEFWEGEESEIDPDKLAEIEAFADQLELERNAAAAEIPVVDEGNLSEVAQRLRSRPVTPATIERLVDLSHEAVERAPALGLSIADLAVELADSIAPNYPRSTPFHYQGMALKQRANALRQLGRYPEALLALDRAEEAFNETTVPGPEVASVNYVRATVFYETFRLDDAARLARAAAEEFLVFGESERHKHARLLEGTILFEAGDLGGAALVFRSLLEETADEDLRSRLMANLGYCLITVDPDAAWSYLQQAIFRYERVGKTTEAARARLGLGRVLARTGKAEAALAHFEEVRDEFERLGMAAAAALAELDAVELLISAGEPRDIEERLRRVAARLPEVGMNSQAATAFAYLGDLAARGSLGSGVIEYVRGFLRHLEASPDDRFLPPEENIS
jgi:tetratricopeptide (TPR) repeat protein